YGTGRKVADADIHESVYGIIEIWVHIEGHNFRILLDIFLNQDRKPELRFQVIDYFVQLIKVRFHFVQKKVLVAVPQLDLELMLGMYVLCHRRIVIIGAHKFYDQRFREIGELVGDAYTAHQELMVRIAQTDMHDAPPKQE